MNGGDGNGAGIGGDTLTPTFFAICLMVLDISAVPRWQFGKCGSNPRCDGVSFVAHVVVIVGCALAAHSVQHRFDPRDC